MKKKITLTVQTNLSMEEAFTLFVRKGNVKNLSADTLKTYQYHFDCFGRFTDTTQPVKLISSDMIDDFTSYIKRECKANDVTVGTYLRTMRAFCYYCIDCGYMENFKIIIPKAEKKIKETYTDDELARLLRKPDLHNSTFTEYKAWVFENYLIATGNRLSSALNVRVEDINFSEGVIIIRKVKNRRQQIIPLSRTLSEILKEYIQIRGGAAADFLFCNVYGEQGNRSSYQQMIRKYNISRNVNKTSAHLFRHTFAKKWILAGGDIFRLQKILGHSDLEITKEYLQMFGQDLQRDFERFNPLDNMKRSNERIKMR